MRHNHLMEQPNGFRMASSLFGSFDDRKMYYLSIPPRATDAEARTLGNEIRFVLQRRQNAFTLSPQTIAYGS